MAMLTAAYANNSSSIFQARNDRYIDDILAAPMLPWQVDVGLTIGGVLRALLIGGALTAIGAPAAGRADRRAAAADRRPRSPRSCCSPRSGVIVGIYAQTWDHHSFVPNLVIQPLAFVGGVFYSVDILPSPWQRAVAREPALLHGGCDPPRVPRAERRVAAGVAADHVRARRRDVPVVGLAVPVGPQAEALGASSGAARQRLAHRRRVARPGSRP